MLDTEREKALLTVARLTVPEILEANLIRASFFLTAYEFLQFSVVNQLRTSYLDYRLSLTPQECESRYQLEVLHLDGHKFGASLKWYEKEGILNAEEVAQAQQFRELRNKVAHCLPQLLTEPEAPIESLDIGLVEVLLAKLNRWFVRNCEIPTIEELDGRNIPDEEIMSGHMAILFLMKETLAKRTSAAR
jgi:hypothetical protein